MLLICTRRVAFEVTLVIAMFWSSYRLITLSLTFNPGFNPSGNLEALPIIEDLDA